MVIVTDKYKPLPRAPKGTVIRAQALRAYATEIEAWCAFCTLSYLMELFLTENIAIKMSHPCAVWV